MRLSVATFLRTAVLTLLLCVSMQSVGFAQGVGAAVILPQAKGDVGTTLTLPVTLDNFVNEDIFAYGFTLKYDASVVSITGATNVGTLSEGALVEVNPGNGETRIEVSAATPIRGEGLLLNLTASLLAPGTSALTIEALQFNEGNPVGRGVAGSVEAMGEPPPPADIVATAPALTVDGQGGAFEIPVAVSGSSTTPVLSYTLSLNYDASVINITGASAAGTVSEGTQLVVNTGTAGVVTIAASGVTPLSTAGTLITLNAEPVGQGTSALDIATFTLNEGTPGSAGVDGSVTVAGPAAEIVATAPSVTADIQGGAFDIPIAVSGSSSTPVLAYTLSLTYDASVMTVTGASAAGTVSEGAQLVVNTGTAGVVTIAASGVTPLSTDGTLITLNATPVAPGASVLDITAFTLNEGTPGSESVDGSVSVTGPPPPPADIVATAPALTVDGQGGAFEIPVAVSGSSTTPVLSYTLSLNYDASVINITGASAAGTVSEGTQLVVNTGTAGVVTIAASGVTPLSTAGTLITLNAEPVGQGTSALDIATFTLNEGTPGSAGVDGSVTVAGPAAEIVATAPSVTADIQGGAFDIPIAVSGSSSTPVLAYTLSLTYDASVMTVTGASAAGTVSEGAQLVVNTGTAGVVTIAASGVTPLSTDGTLITLNATPVAPGSSALDITTFALNEGTPGSEAVDGSVTIQGIPPVEGIATRLPELEIGYSPNAIQIPIWLASEEATAPVLSYSFTMTYEPTLLTITGVNAEGTASEGALFVVNTNTPGQVTVVASGTSEIAQTGTLVYLTGTLSGVGSSPLAFSDFTFNEGVPPATIQNGSLQVLDVDYAARLSGITEVQPVLTMAKGQIIADLSGTNLIVSGDFEGLSSPVATQLAGGAHIHMGMVGMNGGVIQPLTLELHEGGQSGRFRAAANTFALTPEQIDALRAGHLYVNIHSENWLGGELRGQILPVPNSAPTASSIESPADGAALTVEGSGMTPFVPSWSAATDAEGNAVGYAWQLASDADFTSVILTVSTKDTTSFGTDYETLDQIMAGAGVVRGGTIKLWHRAISTDGSMWTNGPGASVELTRGIVDVMWGATLSGVNALPPNPTQAVGNVLAVLDGDVLSVEGAFQGLSSELLPIGDIGPAHLHIAPVGEAGGVAFPLTVSTSDNLSGTFELSDNMFTLSAEQKAAFMAGHFYVNIHTQNVPTGELRGQILKLPNAAPSAPAILAPADAAEITVEGEGDLPFDIAWSSSADPDSNAVAYFWQLAVDDAFDLTVLVIPTAGDTTLTLEFGDIDALLEGAGLDVGESVTLWHRAVATDGSLWAAGAGASVVLTRGYVDTAFLQFIHNVPGPPEAQDLPVDVWVDGELWATLSYLEATPLWEVPSGDAIEVALANPADSTIILAVDLDLDFLGFYAAMATGAIPQNNLEIISGEIEPQAENADDVDIFVIHGVADAPPVDINVLDDGPNHQVLGPLVDDLGYTEADGYFSVAPGPVNLQVTTGDGSQELDVFRPDFTGLEGQSLLVIAQGTARPNDPFPFEVAAYDVFGNRFVSGVVTSNEPTSSELPTEFALDGNYPNPFNPSTTISFDLPAPAEVSVEIYNVLGRQVMTVPVQALQAGHNRTLRVDGSSLASGVYLYRLIATSATDTKVLSGKMTLIK